MKHVSLIVPQGESVLACIVGTSEIFNKVNDFMIQTGQATGPVFKVDYVGLTNEAMQFEGSISVQPTKTIAEISTTDLIVLPAFTSEPVSTLEKNRDLIKWVGHMHRAKGAEVASLCTGAFFLAATGLIDGKTCSTHWVAQEAFANLFPKVEMLPGTIITDEGGIYSSGGAYSFLNLLLYLVEKYTTRETAIWASKLFEIDIERHTQSPFAIFMGQKSHDDKHIIQTQQYIETNFAKKITVEELADRVAISRRNFIRRFKKATSNTPIEYIQRVKIEAAKKQLESGHENVTEVMYNVGYNDSKAFRTIFRKFTGLSPVEYRSRFRKMKVAV